MEKVRALGNLLCGIVGTLGFAPVESLVAVVMNDGVPDCVLRVDLRDVMDGDAARLVEAVASQDGDGVVVVIVSEDTSAGWASGARWRGLVDEVSAELERLGQQVLDRVVVGQIAAGARWSSLDDGCVAGVLEDPATSEVFVSSVASGRRMYGSRAELLAYVAVNAERAEALAPLLRGGGAVESVTASVGRAAALVRCAAAGRAVADSELAEVAASLVDKRVRDALFKVDGPDAVAAAESLWGLLARVTPNPYRAEALVLLAFSAYTRGDGPLAGVALGAVLAECPVHRMAGMLDTALQVGIRPEVLRQLVEDIEPALTV